ncbi:MAG: DUF2723 domain-containing protein [Elusimicrobia bacterium]|nr:DUF2723 domain-containing protein [Candidatus Liberimonas magnetica]
MKITLFLLVVAIYVISSPPALMTGDGGEFITSACTLGISHPPGFPLYCLLGKLFSLIPASNSAWRITFSSVIFSALNSVLLFILVFKLTKNTWVSFFGGIIYAVNATVWSQALVAKVYPLNAFMIIACLIFLLKWQRDGDNRYFYLFGLLFGISLANHYPLMAVASPAYLVLILLNYRSLTLKDMAISTGFFISGLFIYAYLPIRSAMSPPNNWGNPHNLSNFLSHVIRKQYKVLELGQAVAFNEKAKFIANYFYELYRQFNLFIIPAVIGLWVSFKNDKRSFLSFVLLFLTNSIMLTYVLQFSFNPERLTIVKVYYIPSYIAFVVFLSIGLNYIYGLFSSKLSRILITVLVLCAVIYDFSFSCQYNHNRNNFVAYDYGKNILSFLKKGSTLFIAKAGDESLFSALYMQKVMRKRQDLNIIDCWGNVFVNVYGDDFPFMPDKEEWQERRNAVEGNIIKNTVDPVYYLTFEPDCVAQSLNLKRNGLIYQVAKAGQNSKNPAENTAIWKLYNYRGMQYRTFADYQEREIAGFYYYMMADDIQTKSTGQSDITLEKAFNVSSDVSWIRNNIGLEYYRKGYYQNAMEKYTALLKDYRDNSIGWFNLGLVYKNMNLPDKALECFENSVKYAPQDLDGYKELADVFYLLGKLDRVERIFSTVLKNNEKYANMYYSSGTELYKKGEFIKAIDEWKKAALIKPDYAIIHYNLGVAYLDLKDFDKARASLNKFLSLEPNSNLNKNVRTALKNIAN